MGAEGTMALKSRMAEWLRPLVFLGRNPLSLFGAALATSTGLTVLAFWGLELLPGRGLAVSPYAGIVFYIILPALFVLGLLLMPAGALLHRRRLVRAGTLPVRYPRIDLNDPLLRRAAGLVATATLANIVILSAATYKGVQYMDSTTFCGTTCHSVMEPEYTTYLQSSHARIACVDCHVAPGPTGFLRAKLGGVRQTFEVTFNRYPRPIRPARLELPSTVTTCESCHNRSRWIGERLVVRRHYDTDAANTEQVSVLIMHIGGVGPTGPAGIHGAHLGPGVRVEYTATDITLQTIAEVRYTDASAAPRCIAAATAVSPAAPVYTARWSAWTATIGSHTASCCPAMRSTRLWRAAPSTRSCPTSSARRWRRCRPVTLAATQLWRAFAAIWRSSTARSTPTCCVRRKSSSKLPLQPHRPSTRTIFSRP